MGKNKLIAIIVIVIALLAFATFTVSVFAFMERNEYVVKQNVIFRINKFTGEMRYFDAKQPGDKYIWVLLIEPQFP